MTRQRYDDTAQRYAALLAVALQQARDAHYLSLTLSGVAAEARCSRQLVAHYFGSVAHLRAEVMRQAVAESDLLVVAQGLVGGCPVALRAPDDIKRAALASLL